MLTKGCAPDRQVGIAKQKIQTWVNMKNNCITAQDMRVALLSNGGVKANHVAVLQANRRTQATVAKIPQLAQFNVWEYSSDGVIRVHRRVSQLT